MSQAALQPFAFHGIPLNLPPDWNLTRFHGTAKKGTLLFADLRAPRLIVRWKTPRFGSPDRALQKLLAKLPKAETISPNAHLLAQPPRSLALLADDRRLYELEWPAPDPSIRPTLLRLAEDLHVLATAPNWPWIVYGIATNAPRTATHSVPLLHPGHTQLVLHYDGTTAHHHAFSLADHHLKNRSLKEWAQHQFRHLPATAVWHESQLEAGCTFITRRLLRPPLVHTFTIRHLPESNQICCTDLAESRKTG